MNITNSLSSSRGTSNLIYRIGTIFERFGLTDSKFEKLINEYSLFTKASNCTATLPITAVILKRHPELIRRFDKNGIEFAIHGYVHIDYHQLNVQDQMEHYKRAMRTFSNCGVQYTGYRSPYLRFNDKTPKALENLEIAYDSSDSIYWNVMDKSKYPRQSWLEYLRVLDFYHSSNAIDKMSLPRFGGTKRNLIEIPVSLPDDEAMVERLGITDEKQMTDIWKSILNETYNRGELFTLQLHPERIFMCEKALKNVINTVKDYQPSIWIATLSEIAGWWKEKSAYNMDVIPAGDGKYQIKAKCSGKATILIRNCTTKAPNYDWKNGYQTVKANEFIIHSTKNPTIGVSTKTSPEAINFIKDEGFTVDINDTPDNYGLYFDNLENFDPSKEKWLSHTIECSDSPIVRFWRWPNDHMSVLTITGDIDSITLFDFLFRLIESRLNKKKVRNTI